MIEELYWLTSEDPARMLKYYTERGFAPGFGGYLKGTEPSARKLRLFAVACCEAAGMRVLDDGEGIVKAAGGVTKLVMNWVLPEANAGRPTQKVKADILRDAVGNPWRPVAFLRPGDRLKMLDATVISIHGKEMRVQPAYSDMLTPATPGVWSIWRPDFLTPTVLSIAQAAYDERGRKCGKCAERLRRAAAMMMGPNTGDDRRHECESEAEKMRRCADCHGSGTIDDGTLDEDRLAVLSDALEEAGCPSVEILAHLRSPGPHYRGMWSLDLVLGKE